MLLRKVKGDDAVHMNFVLGYSSKDDIAVNGSNNTRDVAVPFEPWVQLPRLADGYTAEGIDFPYHDFYHTFSCSITPTEVRQLSSEAWKLSSSQFFQGIETLFEDNYRDFMLDMDFALFQPDAPHDTITVTPAIDEKLKAKDPVTIFFMYNVVMFIRITKQIEDPQGRGWIYTYQAGTEIIRTMMKINKLHDGKDVTGLRYLLSESPKDNWRFNALQRIYKSELEFD